MALLTHFLACAFGMGSWVAVNGLWVELPVLVTILPEQWDLPSYITIIIQMANVGPLFVTLMHRFRPGLLKDVAVIYVIVSVGVLACLLLAFFWDHTTSIAGRPRSTAFMILTFFLALVDCTSSVTFLPFMIQLQPRYLTTFFIGEGLSGLIPAMIALGQGSGIFSCNNVTHLVNITSGNETVETTIIQLETHYLPANFSTFFFFLLMTVMMMVCLLAFFFLTRQPKVWEVSQQQLFPRSIVLSSFDQIPDEGADSQLNRGCACPKDAKGPGDILPEKAYYPLAKLTFIYFLTAWASTLMNGVLPSVQSYSCLPYGNIAYHLAATLSSVANPLACVVATLLPSRDTLGEEDGVSMEPSGYAIGLCSSPWPCWQCSPVSLACPLQVPGPAGHPHRGRDGLCCLQHDHRRDESLPTPPAVPVGQCHHRPLLGALHRDALLREGDGRGDPAEPQPQRADVVRGTGTAGLPPGGPDHVPPRQHLWLLQIC